MAEAAVVVGIDVSKTRLEVACSDRAEAWSEENTAAGVGALVPRLQALRPALVVLEATGGYERAAVASLAAAGLPVVVANPRQIRAFARAVGQLAKTDRLDAAMLARFGAQVRPAPRPLPDAQAQELDALLTRRRQLLDMLTAEKNRVAAAPPSVRQGITQHIRWLERQLADVDGELGALIEASPLWRAHDDLLQSVPGVGPVLSRTLLGELPELGRLTLVRWPLVLSRAQVATNSDFRTVALSSMSRSTTAATSERDTVGKPCSGKCSATRARPVRGPFVNPAGYTIVQSSADPTIAASPAALSA
jgi:transposase